MNISKKLKIGLDFHGVITADILYFKDFANEAMSRGHEVHIITGGPKEYIKNFLTREGIKFTCIFAIMDYYKKRGGGKFVEDEFYVHDELWNAAKSKYYNKMGIDFHIDDKTNFKHDNMFMCQYNSISKCCKILGENISLDFSKDASLAIDELEMLIKSKKKALDKA